MSETRMRDDEDPEDTEFSLHDEPVTDEMVLDRFADHRPGVKKMREALEKIVKGIESITEGDSTDMLTPAEEAAWDIALAALTEPSPSKTEGEGRPKVIETDLCENCGHGAGLHIGKVCHHETSKTPPYYDRCRCNGYAPASEGEGEAEPSAPKAEEAEPVGWASPVDLDLLRNHTIPMVILSRMGEGEEDDIPLFTAPPEPASHKAGGENDG